MKGELSPPFLYMKNLLEIAGVFLKLGTIGFGGPAAHIAMMEDEIVHKRKWMDRDHFLDLTGATNLIPGPNSTEMTMHCGYQRAGIGGLFVAGISFILPAVIITGVLAWFYFVYGNLPEVLPFTYGIKAAVLAIIASAILKLGKKAYKNIELGVLGLYVFALAFLGFNEIAVLLVAGLFGAIYFSAKKRFGGSVKSIIPLFLLNVAASKVSALSSLKIFLIFLKIGAVLYGSGYVLFAYLDSELVTAGLLTREQLADAIAIGQFTPGPVLSTATFIGYQMNGFWGALAATGGIFLPSFLFVLVLNPLIPKMRKSVFLSYFLDSVNMAAVAIMVVVLTKMGIETLIDWRQIVIAVVSIAVVFVFKKLNSFWIVLGGSGAGYLLALL